MNKSCTLVPIVSFAKRLQSPRTAVAATGITILSGLATAMALTSSEPDTIASTQIIEQLHTEPARVSHWEEPLFSREERIQKGDTLGRLLFRMGINDPVANAFLTTTPEIQKISEQLAPGKSVSTRSNSKGELFHLHFPLNGSDKALEIERTGQSFATREITEHLETRRIFKSGEIRNALFGATDIADIPDNIAIQLAELFAADIDFHRDLRKGDRFSVIYEMHYTRGKPLRSGRILSAEFINAGKTFRALWFEHEGKGGYYTPDGKALRKAFLRSPLEFSRITSGFSMRFHPLLQEWRSHKGIDYGAPQGTRVRATGDGSVEFIGPQKGYGNLMILKHAGNYSTVYAHLQGFIKGLRKGSRINQGDTIGFVGQTGWATGPHLHYELRINDQQVNPMSLKQPSMITLEKSQFLKFKQTANVLIDQLGTLSLAAPSNFE